MTKNAKFPLTLELNSLPLVKISLSTNDSSIFLNSVQIRSDIGKIGS